MRFLSPTTLLVALSGLVQACASAPDLASGASHAAEAHAGTLTRLRTPLGNFDPVTQSLPELAQALSARIATPASTVQTRSWLVQFDTDVTAGLRLDVADTGATIVGFWPDRALLVRATQAQAQGLGRLPRVRAVVAQPHLWRLDTRLVQAESQGFGLSRIAQNQDILVSVHEASDLQSVVGRAQALGAQLVGDLPRPEAQVVHLTVPQAALGALSADDAVAFIEPFNELVAHNDTSYGVIQGGSAHRSPMWDRGLHGEGQILASCDVGVQTGSCFFPAGKIIGYERLTTSTQHVLTHGTHVAGSLVGDQNGNGTYDLDDGMAPGAKLYVQDAGVDRTGVLNLPADLTSLFASAYAHGARIHSDSWGTLSGTGGLATYGSRERALDSFVAAHRDFLVVLAAGNNSASGAPTVIDSPAAAKDIITVGAIQGLAIDNAASFSSDGPCADGRIKPTLMAPGVNVVSASTAACGTTVLSGTSQAAPTLAGGAALVRQYLMEGYYPSGAPDATHVMTPSAAIIKAMLIAGAVPMTGDNTGGALLANGEGFGRVHIGNAAPMAGDAAQLWLNDDTAGLGQDGSMTVTLNVRAPGDVHVALTWNDVAGTLGAVKALVNDLDLSVTGPGGTYLGNVMQKSVSTATSSTQDGDHTNVEEVIRLVNAPAGSYTIRVVATQIPQGPQPFAVAALLPTYTTQTTQTVATTDAPVPPMPLAVSSTNTSGGDAANTNASGCASASASTQLVWPAAAWALYRLVQSMRRRRRTSATL